MTDRYEKAKSLIEGGKLDEAEGILNGLNDSDISDPLVLFELGKIKLLKGDNQKAIFNFTKSLKILPDNGSCKLLLGKAYNNLGRKDEAIKLFKEVRKSSSNEENIDYEIALSYRDMGDFENAVKYFKKAFENGMTRKKYNEETNAVFRQKIDEIKDFNARGKYKRALKEICNARKYLPEDNERMQNTILGEEEIACKNIQMLSYPRSITVTLTNKCNLKCLMCKTRKQPWDLPLQAKEEIKNLFPYIERVMWQGGEAFMYKHFEELLDEAARYDIRQVLATNGLLINERIARKLVRYNVELTFSIDGANKKVYENIRLGASWEKVIEKLNLINNLRKELNPNMKTRLNVLIMRANYRQIEDFVDFAGKYEFNRLFFNSVGCDFTNKEENVFYYNHDKEVIAYINKKRDILNDKAKKYGIILENWLPEEQFFEKAEKVKQEITIGASVNIYEEERKNNIEQDECQVHKHDNLKKNYTEKIDNKCEKEDFQLSGYFDFYMEEFKSDKLNLHQMLEKIKEIDTLEIEGEGVEALNAILKTPDFYEKWKEWGEITERGCGLPEDGRLKKIEHIIICTEELRKKVFDDLSSIEQERIKRLNRFLLEEIFSDICPRSQLFCHAPWQRMYIDIGGEVRPDCLCKVSDSIGTLKNKTLYQLWNSEKMKEYRHKIIYGDLKLLCNPDCICGRVPEMNLKYI